MGKFVIGIDHDDEIDLALGQAGVLDRAEKRLDIGDLFQLLTAFDEVEHLLLDVLRDNFALRNEGGDEKREISRACTDVGDHVGWLEVEILDDEGRLFLSLTITALQPGDGVRADRLRDLTSHVNFANAVARGLLSRVVPLVGACRLRKENDPGEGGGDKEIGRSAVHQFMNSLREPC